jgi:hypothetical protein
MVMGIKKSATLFAAVVAISVQAAAAEAACDPSAGLKFICGMTNSEDLVQVPGTPWIVASGLADAEHADGHIYLVNAQQRTLQVLLPGHVVYRHDTDAFGDCPGKADETKFSAHGLGLRSGPGSEHTLYVMHHGDRESVEVFRLKTGAEAPTLTWVGCVMFPAGVLGNGVAALPSGAFAASNFLSSNDPKAAEKLMAGKPAGGVLIWQPKRGWKDVPDAAAISAANGLAASPDGKQLFVAGWRDETVVRLSLDGKTKQRAVIKTGFHTDNLRFGSDGFLYASGQRDTLPNLFACALNTRQLCTSPFSVLRIDPATLATREVVTHPGGPSFGAGSTALRIGDEFWFGTPHGDRIAIAPAR